MSKIEVTFSRTAFNDAKELSMPNIRLNALSYDEFKTHIPIYEIDSTVLLKFFAETNLIIRHTIIDKNGEGVHFDMFGAFPIDGSFLPSSGLYDTPNCISTANRYCDIAILELCDSIEANNDFNAYIVHDGKNTKTIKTTNTNCNYKI